jgi:hypothetical protein
MPYFARPMTGIGLGITDTTAATPTKQLTRIYLGKGGKRDVWMRRTCDDEVIEHGPLLE